MADAPSGSSASDSGIGREGATAVTNVGLTAQERDNMGPGAKPSKIPGNAERAQEMQHFAAWGSKMNIIRNSDLSLRSAASNIRYSGSFCETTQSSRPPAEDGVLASSRVFAPESTFAINVAHIEKACVPMEPDSKWRPRAISIVRHSIVCRGLSEAGGRSLSPRQAPASRRLFQISKLGIPSA